MSVNAPRGFGLSPHGAPVVTAQGAIRQQPARKRSPMAVLPTKRTRGSKWQAIRRSVLRLMPLCVECQRKGRVTIASEVDHIKPLHMGGDDDLGNLQALCHDCHADKTAAELGKGRRKATGLDGWPIDEQRPSRFGHSDFFPGWLKPSKAELTIVFGPPASGKTTHVRTHAQPGDVVIDLDEITARLSGLPWYSGGDFWLKPAIAARNKMLSDLHTHDGAAWFIATGSDDAERAWWINTLRPAHVVVIRTSKADCLARIAADPRRAAVAGRQAQAIRDWR